jgi:Mrp family chromosome partitioning ATPase
MIIVIANSKGGVGKSTIAVHLTVWLKELGHSVILADNTVRLSATPRPLIPCVRQNMGSQGGGKHATARTLYRQ